VFLSVVKLIPEQQNPPGTLPDLKLTAPLEYIQELVNPCPKYGKVKFKGMFTLASSLM
jgi:hypothetical protein